MKANELRIGNFVIRQGTQIAVDGSDIKFFEDGSYVGIEPIPLTKEWLVTFGFKDLDYGEFELGCFLLDREYTDKGEWEFCHLGKRICTIYYVHQLQNLYFAIMNEELNIKL